MMQYNRQPVLNANCNTEDMTLVTHHLSHRYLASLCRMQGMPILPTSILALSWPRLLPMALSPASPPSLACHVWLISQSLCTLARMRLVMRSLSWCGDNFYAIRESTKRMWSLILLSGLFIKRRRKEVYLYGTFPTWRQFKVLYIMN